MTKDQLADYVARAILGLVGEHDFRLPVTVQVRLTESGSGQSYELEPGVYLDYLSIVTAKTEPKSVVIWDEMKHLALNTASPAGTIMGVPLMACEPEPCKVDVDQALVAGLPPMPPMPNLLANWANPDDPAIVEGKP